MARLLRENPKLADELVVHDDLNLTCLHLAVIKGHTTIVKQLLTVNLEFIKIKDSLGNSTLGFAVEYGQEAIVAILVESVISSPGYDEALFHDALASGYDNIASQILAQIPHLIENSDMKTLHLAAQHGCSTVVARLLAAKSHLIEVGSLDGKSVLHIMAEYGCDKIVSQLIAEKPHLIDVDCSKNAVLMAAQNGHEKVVAHLLSVRPALASQVSQDGQTALHRAAECGHEGIVAQLLSVAPALATQRDPLGRTALHKAAQHGHDKVLAQLLAHSPELLSATDEWGRTALFFAIYASPQAVACLLAHGAVGVDAKALWELLQCQREKDASDVVKLLLEHSPELIQSVDSNRNTILHCVFGCRRTFDSEKQLFSEDLMRTVWRMVPEALRATNKDNETPFDTALANRNNFAIELVQGHLSLDEMHFQYFWQCPQSLLDPIWESLVEVLHKDVAGTVYEYLGLWRVSAFGIDRRPKRMKLQ